MRLRWWLTGAALIVLALSAPKVREYLAVDRCLDRGGRWDRSSGTCVSPTPLAHPGAAPPPTSHERAACARAEWSDTVATPAYWPPGVFHANAGRLGRVRVDDALGPDSLAASSSAFSASWYSRVLCAMGEPPLSAPEAGRTRLRFLAVPAFGPSTAVRLERSPGRTEMVVTRVDGGGGPPPGSIRDRVEGVVSGEEWATLEELIREEGFWWSETSRPGGDDGTWWVLEISEPDRYHVIERWDASEIGRFLLARAGMAHGTAR